MAVKVGTCGPGMPCLAQCGREARFSAQREDLLKLHYCGPCARRRIATHRRLGRQIVFIGEAKRLLDEVWAP